MLWIEAEEPGHCTFSETQNQSGSKTTPGIHNRSQSSDRLMREEEQKNRENYCPTSVTSYIFDLSCQDCVNQFLNAKSFLLSDVDT